MPRKIWTKKEDNYLRKNICTKPYVELANELNTTLSSIKNRLFKLGLKLPDSIREVRSSIGRFREGHISFNKGRKQSEYMDKKAIARTKKTRFKKGNLPHNTKANGVISIRPDKRGVKYQFIRTSLSKWLPLHRYNWEKEKGEIPPGMIIRFKDGNTMNCEVSNLELINRSQHMSKNTIHRYSPELKSTIRLVHKLNRTITKKTNEKL
ncbi:MAG TPA: HNH endonuclease signature motif containing protein [Bacteroidia bacterium]|nr:HNH endonuclease signature motif containing protein [Bacteroidia bacterium]